MFESYIGACIRNNRRDSWISNSSFTISMILCVIRKASFLLLSLKEYQEMERIIFEFSKFVRFFDSSKQKLSYCMGQDTILQDVEYHECQFLALLLWIELLKIRKEVISFLKNGCFIEIFVTTETYSESHIIAISMLGWSKMSFIFKIKVFLPFRANQSERVFVLNSFQQKYKKKWKIRNDWSAVVVSNCFSLFLDRWLIINHSFPSFKVMVGAPCKQSYLLNFHDTSPWFEENACMSWDIQILIDAEWFMRFARFHFESNSEKYT